MSIHDFDVETSESRAGGVPASVSRRWLLRASWLVIAAASVWPGFWTSRAAPSAEQNWPQWRGPLANGVAPQANPPIEWSETKNLKWKIKTPGGGSATPIVWGNQIFLQVAIPAAQKTNPAAATDNQAAPGRRGGGGGRGMSVAPTTAQQWALLCLDRPTGKTLWQKVAREEFPHEGHHPSHGFSSYSPVTDGKSVFAYFGSHGLYCYDLNGNLRWQKDLGRMQTKLGFGEGGSPALFGNTLVILWDHEGQDFIVALNKETGAELWRQAREEGTSWSTPFIVQNGSQTEIVTSATSKIRSYDPASGKLLWECSGMGPNAIPTPVAAHGMVYATTGFQRFKLLAIRLGGKGDLTGTDTIAWSLDRNTPYVASPLVYGDRLYLSKERNAIVSCYDAKTGRPHYEAERLEGLNDVIYASPVAANGRVYFVGRNGTTVVLKDSDKFEVLATNRLEEEFAANQPGFDASPALVGKELLLRGRESLYCFEQP